MTIPCFSTLAAHGRGWLERALLLSAAAWIAACGESQSGPDRRVMTVLTSRDSVYLDVADTALLLAEARDVSGNTIPDAGITWQSLDGLVATVSANGLMGRVVGVASGVTVVTAAAGGKEGRTVVTTFPPIIATTLANHADTAWAVGDTLEIGISSQTATGPRIGKYAVVSRSPAVLAWVDPERHVVLVTALVQGEGNVVVTERRGTRDSAHVVVRQRPRHIIVTPSVLSGFVGRTTALTASVRDARNNPIPAQPVAWRSADTSVAGVDSSGLVSYRTAGTTGIIATSGTVADTTALTALPKPKLALTNLVVGHSHDSLEVGVHEVSDSFTVYASDAVSPWVHLRMVDTTVATAPDSVMYTGAGGVFGVRGRRVGRTLLIGDAPLEAPDTVRVRVSMPRLVINDPFVLVPIALPSDSNVQFWISTADSSGMPHPVADTVQVTVRSSDSAVLNLYQSPNPYVITPSNCCGPQIRVRAQDSGRAIIRATAPGFITDSMAWRIPPGPKLRFIEGRSEMLGASQTAPGLRLTSIGPEKPGDTVVVMLTQRHPASVSLPARLTMTDYTGRGLIASYAVDALLPGTDTVIASAPAHEPDTAVITVTTPHILVSDTVFGTTLGGFANVFVGDSLGVRHAPKDALLLLTTSSDTTVARGSSTRIPAGWGALWTLEFPSGDTGVATMTVRDSAGVYQPKVIRYGVALDSSLHVVSSDGHQYGPAATQQRFEPTRFLVTYPNLPAPGRVVHLSTTVPGVLRIPDSIAIAGSGYAYFPGAGGDNAGTTQIVAMAHGFRPDTSSPVAVGRGHFKLDVPANAFVGIAGYSAAVHALSPNGVELAMDQDLPLTLVALDGGISIQSPTVTVPVGQAVSPATGLSFTTPGLLRLAVEDLRPVPAPFIADTVIIHAQSPRLHLTSQSGAGLTVSVGQRLDCIISRPPELQADALWVTVAHDGSRGGSTPNALLSAGVASAPFPIVGLAIGTDQVVLSAPGYASDTTLVTVTAGSVAVASWPNTLRTGDSVSVALQVGDSALVPHVLSEATTFTIETSGGIRVSDGTRNLSEITVPAGALSSAPVFVVATATGTASVTLSNLHYTSASFFTTVSARP